MKKLIILTLLIYVTVVEAEVINNIEVKADSLKTKIIILSGSLNYKNITLNNPERVVIDIQNALSKLTPKIEINNHPVISIRSSQYKISPLPVTRIVIDLAQPVDYSINKVEKGIELNFTKSSSMQSTTEPVVPVEAETSDELVVSETTDNSENPIVSEKETQVESEVSEPETSYIDSLLADSISTPKESISQSTIRKDTTVPLKEPFFYNSRGKRDPFRPWLGIESGSSDSLLDISTSVIVGIMWSPKERYALAQDNTGKGYVLCEGDKVWNGKVERIEKDNVIFALHGFGGIKRITLKLLPKEERKKEGQ